MIIQTILISALFSIHFVHSATPASTCSDEELATRMSSATFTNGPAASATVVSQQIPLSPYEYTLELGQYQPWSIAGIWSTDAAGPIGVTEPSGGIYTRIEYADKQIITEKIIYGIHFNTTDYTYPNSQAAYGNGEFQVTCDKTKKAVIKDYVSKKRLGETTLPTLPTLTAKKIVPYWGTFKTIDNTVTQTSEIKDFNWVDATKTLTVSFQTCNAASSCLYKDSSKYLIRLQSSPGSFLFWMASEDAGLVTRGQENVQTTTKTITRTFTTESAGYTFPDYVEQLLRGQRPKKAGIQILIIHCWGTGGDFACNEGKTAVMPSSS